MVSSLIFPILFLGLTIILIIRVGWSAVIAIVFYCLTIPCLRWLSKKNAEIIKEINRFKDKRVQLTSEIIDGIKYIKLYGW